jgi:release factor glutamine methyltransferase
MIKNPENYFILDRQISKQNKFRAMKNWKILEILKWTTGFFKEKQIINPRLNAEYIISHVLGCKRFDLYVRFEEIVSLENREKIKKMVIERAKSKPLQYVIGETEFYGHRFFVNESVLIPRPETEYLVEKIITEIDSYNTILDIGSGSGAIAITLKKELPYLSITAVDISASALKIATENAKLNQVEIEFIESDIFSKLNTKFDIIVSNPPYIPQKEYEALDKEILEYEPKLALLAEDDGLYFYRRILSEAKLYLNVNGKIYFEIGYNQSDRIKKIAENNGFTEIETLKDLNGFDRIMIIK